MLDHFGIFYKHRIEELEESFKDLKDGEQSFDFWHLYGHRNLILKMKEVIELRKNTCNEFVEKGSKSFRERTCES